MNLFKILQNEFLLLFRVYSQRFFRVEIEVLDFSLLILSRILLKNVNVTFSLF